jgi:hypothetical protein
MSVGGILTHRTTKAKVLLTASHAVGLAQSVCFGSVSLRVRQPPCIDPEIDVALLDLPPSASFGPSFSSTWVQKREGDVVVIHGYHGVLTGALESVDSSVCLVWDGVQLISRRCYRFHVPRSTPVIAGYSGGSVAVGTSLAGIVLGCLTTLPHVGFMTDINQILAMYQNQYHVR